MYKNRKNKLPRTAMLVLLLMCLSLPLSACGGSQATTDRTMADAANDFNNTSADFMKGQIAQDYPVTTAENSEAAANHEKPPVADISNLPDAAARKLIKNIRITMETQEFEETVQKIRDMVMLEGGYIESSSVSGVELGSHNRRTASYTIRIPADKIEQAETALAGMGNITNSISEIKDISLTYADTAAKIEALRAQQSSLLEMMKKADKISDMLQIREQLTQVEYELESYSSRLRVMDNQVSYSSLMLNLREVKLYTEKPVEPQGVFERIGQGLKSTLEGIGSFFEEAFVFLASRLPLLLLMAVILTPLILLLRRRYRRIASHADGETKNENADAAVSAKDPEKN